MQELTQSERVRKFAVLLVIMTLCGTFVQLASAQTSRGAVVGTVKDPNGGVIPGTMVTLTKVDTGIDRQTTTNGEGFYRFDAVDLGTYKLTFAAPGFSNLAKTDVKVSANQTAVVDSELTVGGIEAAVSVVEQAGVLLQTEVSTRGGNITETQITELPFAGRNPVLLALTLPGVSSNRGGFGDNTFAVNGARGRSNNFLIDGTENNDISVAGQGFKITNPDAIQEVSIQTSNYDAEFGRSGGAVINTITKSGTNQFHGTLSYLLDSRVDDAITSSESRDPQIAKAGKPPFGIENIFAATVGGPLERDKTFFFTAYQDDRQRSNLQSQITAPTAAGRARLRQLFPPGASANADLYLNATEKTIAAPTDPPTNIALGVGTDGVDRGNVEFGNFFRNFKYIVPDKQFQVRVDRLLSPKDNLSGRFLLDAQVVPFGGTVGTPTFEGFDADYSQHYYNFLVANTHTFSPAITNETRIAYNRIDLGFPISDPNGPGRHSSATRRNKHNLIRDIDEFSAGSNCK